MRAVAYWPHYARRFQVERDAAGAPYMAVEEPNFSERSREGVEAYREPLEQKARTVFWVLATKEEALEHIVPHMVNAVIHWKSVLKLEELNLEAFESAWRQDGEFLFFVPIEPKLTDAPFASLRLFPYTGKNQCPPWDIGSVTEGACKAEGVQISDIKPATLLGLRQKLIDSGDWKTGLRGLPSLP